MAVVGTASELSTGRQGGDNEEGVNTRTRTFAVYTSVASDDSKIVLNAPGLPVIGEQYVTATSSDLASRVIERNAVQDEKSRKFWRVTVVYSNEYDQEATQATASSLDEPPDIQHESETYDEVLPGMPSPISANAAAPPPTAPAEELTGPRPGNGQQYSNWSGGRGIVNSAGWPYNPPPTQPATRPIIIFTRNELDYTLLKKVRYENSVNSQPWNGLQPRQAWCRSITAQQYIWRSSQSGLPDQYYYRVTYTFALKWESWDLQLLDYGWYYLKWADGDFGGINGGETPTIKTFSTNDGDPIFGLLDNSDTNKPGRKLAAGQPPQWRIFPTKRQQDFTQLDIDLNLNLTNIRTRYRN
jgi:hypothetical protein